MRLKRELYNVMSKNDTLNHLLQKWNEYKNRERMIHQGHENKDIIFYVIGMDDTIGGLFWLINKSLMHIAYAVEHNYVPIVDFQNNRTQYQAAELYGIDNIWEYYFKQPMGYGLQDIKKSKFVIMAKKSHTPDEAHFMGNFYDNPERIGYFRNFFKKYIIVNDRTKAYLDSSYMNLISNQGKVLGVLCRGTDYIMSKPKGHPIPPTAEETIRCAKAVMEKYHCQKIFLATEDEDVYNDFYGEFKDKLLTNNQVRLSKTQMQGNKLLAGYRDELFTTKEQKYKAGLEYLVAIYLLSKCDCFIGSRCGGTKGVLMMTDGFEYQYIFNLGMC